MLFVGIDPGKSGSTVLGVRLCYEFEVLAMATWSEVQRKNLKRVRLRMSWFDEDGEKHSSDATVSNMAVCAATVAHRFQRMIPYGEKCRTICEDTHVGLNPRGSISLAHHSGITVHPFQVFSSETHWVLAKDWRNILLGLGYFTKTDEAKEKTRKYVSCIKGFNELAELSGGGEHACDATGVCAYASGATHDRGVVEWKPIVKKKRKKKPKKSSKAGSKGKKGQT